MSVGLLRRAVELLPPQAPERLDDRAVLADVLVWVDEHDEAARVLDAAAAAAHPDDAPAQARLVVARHHLSLWGPGEHDPEVMVDDVQRAITVLEQAGDHEALAYAYLVAYHASYRRAAVTRSPQLDSEEHFRLAAEHARAAGARHLEGMAAVWLCVLLRRGWQPVEDAKRRMHAVLEDPPTRNAYAAALGGLGLLRAMEGAFDEGRALVAEGNGIIRELGLGHAATADLINLADVEIIAGDLGAAECFLRAAVVELDTMGDAFSAVNAAWRLALVLVAARRDDEAAAYLERRSDVDAGEWVEAWRLVLRATLAARRGESSDARHLLDRADRVMAELNAGGMEVDVLRQAAEASATAGQLEDARARLERAADLAGRLGYVVGERAAREQLAALGERTDG